MRWAYLPTAIAAGLRREEVSQLAGAGLAWYTWREQGREITPSSTKAIEYLDLGRLTLHHLQSIPTSHPDLRLTESRGARRLVASRELQILDRAAGMGLAKCMVTSISEAPRTDTPPLLASAPC